MEELYTRFDGVFFEKTRLSIMTLLNQEEKLAFNALKQRLGGSDGGIYTHLEKLIAAGYVGKEREIVAGTPRTLYFLTTAGHRAFAEYIEFLAQIIPSQGAPR
ncbi:MAG: transcriptional regulator [Spirochaeta sp.]|jgi:predicted ArsR family transcriptional regulator|nr:transcriptional regulator [Spirochaeta sp.]